METVRIPSFHEFCLERNLHPDPRSPARELYAEHVKKTLGLTELERVGLSAREFVRLDGEWFVREEHEVFFTSFNPALEERVVTYLCPCGNTHFQVKILHGYELEVTLICPKCGLQGLV